MARYEEAEAVLLDAQRDLQAMPDRHDRDATAAIKRLAALYEAWGRSDRAAVYRGRLPS
jgi:hypothetical protein